MNIIEEILRLPDMTGVIKARKRPVLLYGMGNGAELTDAYLRSRGIIPDGVFASDGFVRGQSFMGKRVLSVAEAEHLYGDFTAVLSFALEGEKRSAAYDFAENHFLVCPSLCPFGGAYDADFVKKNASALAGLHDRLADVTELEVVVSVDVVRFDLNGSTVEENRRGAALCEDTLNSLCRRRTKGKA